MAEDIQAETDSREGRQREYRGWMAWVVKALSALIPLYTIFYILDVTGSYFHVHFFETAYLAVFLCLVLVLVFLLYPATGKAPRDRLPWYDQLLIIAALAPTLNEFLLASDVAYGTKLGVTALDQVLFAILIITVFEAIRRTFGWSVLAVAIVALLYAEFAFLIPGLWGAPRFTFDRLTAYMYIYDTGMFGVILGIGATIIIVFVTFGNFLVGAGTSRLMMDGALALVGRWRGGAAKVAIIASAAMATISGSASANAGTIGPITIPLMRKVGYKADFAAAVEAVASTGGIITPPVMGSVAFIMAEITGLGYSAVIIAAVLPALLYYMALYFQLDFEAARLGLVGMNREQLPSLKKALREYWHLSLPIILLAVLLVVRYDVLESALLAIVSTVFVSWFRKGTRMSFSKIVDALARSTQGVLGLTTVMAAVGIVFGAVAITGLGINLATLITDAARGNLWLLAILTWLVIYISGTALAEIVVYIIMAVIVAPAFISLGMPVLAAHMFIFLACTSSMITPPDCPPVYVTCAIANSGLWRTGFQAMKLGIVVFLVPFMLISNPVLILQGPPGEIALAAATSIVGVYFLAAGVAGYFLRKAIWWQRLLFIAGGVTLFMHGWKTDILGLTLLLIPTFAQFASWRRTKRGLTVPS